MQRSSNFEKGFNIKEYEVFEGNIKLHPDVVIGKNSNIGHNTTIHNSILGTINIGSDCIVGNYSILEDNVTVADETKIWHYTHIRSDVTIGKKCILGNYVYIDSGVTIGNETKIQNYVPVYHGVELEDGIFLGPNSLTTNDMIPRARTETGDIQGESDWKVTSTHISKDVSIGAGAVIRPGVTIGEKALIGAGAVVIRDVPPGAVVVGNPGKIIKYVEGYEPK
jgi:acetyltransferase-like isoleucine patch superfamily enzyme